MKKYTVDFTTIEHYLEMHFIIKEALDFPITMVVIGLLFGIV